MPFVPRVILRLPHFPVRRSYSFLSNKHGRSWFNASKAAAAKQQRQARQPQPQPHSITTADPAKGESVDLIAEGMKDGGVAERESLAAGSSVEPALSASVSISSALTWPAPSLPPTDHPQPSPSSLALDRFFCLERPLLSLSVPLSKPSQATLSEDADPEAEADAARLLARALVMNKLGPEKDWQAVMRRLEGKEEEEEAGGVSVSLDSVKRKRRKKMSKHKYKKRRKLQRSERRRLGK